MKLHFLLFFLIIISCSKSHNHIKLTPGQIKPSSIDSNGWYKSYYFKKELGDNLDSKFIQLKKYSNNRLIEHIEVESAPGDTIKVNSITFKYFKPTDIEYNYIWVHKLDQSWSLTTLTIQANPNTIDTIYYFYPDKSVKSINCDFKKESLIRTEIQYKPGEYFIDLQRIDTLPGVIPTDLYYILE